VAFLQQGERIGDWVVESRLGEGATAEVYRCRHAMSERMGAAVKLFYHDIAESREKWFAREVEALSSLQHPGIVRILHPGVDKERGLLFLAMELVEGKTLLHQLAEGPFPVHRVRKIFIGIAEALALAHAQSIYHRDIKPSNIMLKANDQPIILDFGIATTVDPSLRTTSAVGTPAYMAPELFGDAEVDPARCDIYGVGVMLYEALTGTRAFPRPKNLSGDAMVMHILQKKSQIAELDPGPGVDAKLRAIVRMATALQPSRRPASMQALLQLLKAEGDAPVVIAPPPPAKGAKELVFWVIGGVLAAIVLSTLAGALTWYLISSYS